VAQQDIICSVCNAAIPAAQLLARPLAVAAVGGVGGGAATKSFWGGLAVAVVTGLITYGIERAAEPVCGRCRARVPARA
jgi:hypothetical protein